MMRTKNATRRSSKKTVEQNALHKRVRRMYDYFNRGLGERCYSLLDPSLRKQATVKLDTCTEGLVAFRNAYGRISPWYVRISLHLDGSKNKHDPRSFAYVYVTWQDDQHGFHMLRERWVKDEGRWYSRVAGLVPNKQSRTE